MEKMTTLEPKQKAAAILLAVGSERAPKLLSHLRSEDIREMMKASEGLKNISEDDLSTIVDEFERECVKGSGLMDSSAAFHTLIEEALTPEQFSEMSEGPDAAQIALKKKTIWELLESIDDSELIEFLISENTQVSSYVLSRLSPKKAATIIGKLDREYRQKIVAGMIKTRPAVREAVLMLEELVTRRFGRTIGANKGSGNQHLVAGMMNELDIELSDNLFEELADVVKPNQLQSVKSLMFRFEDVVSLDNASRSALFDQIETDLTTTALRDASPEIRECVLSALGQRTRRMLESELESDLSVPADDIKAAQRKIASTVLKLAAQGALTIPTPSIAA